MKYLIYDEFDEMSVCDVLTPAVMNAWDAGIITIIRFTGDRFEYLSGVTSPGCWVEVLKCQWQNGVKK